MNFQEIEMHKVRTEEFDGRQYRPDERDKPPTGVNPAETFDFIANQAKREFKFQLMIKARELFPTQLSECRNIQRITQQDLRPNHSSHQEG